MYPESHGIVDNAFYDNILHENFNAFDSTSDKTYWWLAEPV